MVYKYKLAKLFDGRIVLERKNAEKDEFYNIIITKKNINDIIQDIMKGYNSTDIFYSYGEEFNNCRIMYEFNIKEMYTELFIFEDLINTLNTIKDKM